ncbi:MAG TPA: GntG family PLP-dependent aldolase [Lentimicrobium sp.]|nr:GntG family PLP-dependent aldolase [Lentimicrobium sp.]
MIIDLRSDTLTKPTQGMLEAMFKAQVGDDVFGEDPTVKALEEKISEMFGKEAGLFCPSGTMTNQIAVNVHTHPGDEIILHKLSHVYYYEGGGIMKNSGASVCLLEGDRGRISPQDVLDHINSDDIHRPPTAMVEVENTMNKGGGSVYDNDNLTDIAKICMENNLKFHLDGARIFNALTITGQSPIDCGKLFDSISICLSKGLGAPVGSVLIGNKEFINKARRVRKVFGGGMRQAGYLAAAGIYALDNHIERLKEDHSRAKKLSELLSSLSWVDKVYECQTNIVLFSVKEPLNAIMVVTRLQQHGLYCIDFDKYTIRFVTHLDFTEELLEQAMKLLKEVKF